MGMNPATTAKAACRPIPARLGLLPPHSIENVGMSVVHLLTRELKHTVDWPVDEKGNTP